MLLTNDVNMYIWHVEIGLIESYVCMYEYVVDKSCICKYQVKEDLIW